jgi:hypothetical protein
MATNNIVEKIAKLLALGKSPNEAEAMAAIAKAQKLMSQYSISESDLENVTQDMGNGFIKQRVSMNHSRFQNWEKNLMMAIAASNFCEVVFYIGTDDIEIYGTRYDAEMVIALYAFIRPQMQKLATIAHKASFTSINGKEWKVSYYMGMVAKIKTLLREVLQLVAKESETGTAIVLKKADLVKAFYEENKGNVKYSKWNFDFNANAYNKGFVDGDKLQLGIEKSNGLLTA